MSTLRPPYDIHQSNSWKDIQTRYNPNRRYGTTVSGGIHRAACADDEDEEGIGLILGSDGVGVGVGLGGGLGLSFDGGIGLMI